METIAQSTEDTPPATAENRPASKTQVDLPPLIADDGEELTRVHPNYAHALRVQALILAIPFVIGSLVVEGIGILPSGVVVGPVALLALIAIIRVPNRRFFARGYDMSVDRLRVLRGIFFRADTVIPFGRVQHIDVNQGPIERFFGIATLTLHTAGNYNASVNLPGLEHSLAVEMREEIRAHIKRESM